MSPVIEWLMQLYRFLRLRQKNGKLAVRDWHLLLECQVKVHEICPIPGGSKHTYIDIVIAAVGVSLNISVHYIYYKDAILLWA